MKKMQNHCIKCKEYIDNWENPMFCTDEVHTRATCINCGTVQSERYEYIGTEEESD